MASRRPAPRKRPGKVRRTTERVVLGAVMGTAAFVLERRLRKAFKKSAKKPPKRERTTVEIG